MPSPPLHRLHPLRVLPGGRPGSPARTPLVVPDYNVETVSQTTGQPITTPPPAAPTQPFFGPLSYPVEYPAPGNTPPSTSPDAVIDPTTGNVVNPVVPVSFLDGVTGWIQANPWWALGLAAGVVWLIVDFFGEGKVTGGFRRGKR